MTRFNDAVLSLLRFLGESLSEDGQGSWSRLGGAIVVLALIYVMITTRRIPERTEQLAWASCSASAGKPKAAWPD